jgi:hypothetical protein
VEKALAAYADLQDICLRRLGPDHPLTRDVIEKRRRLQDHTGSAPP